MPPSVLPPGVSLPVPLVHQATTYSCGTAALFAVLLYWRGHRLPYRREADLWDDVGMSGEGVDSNPLAAVPQKLGLKTRVFTRMSLEDLRYCLGIGATVILSIQAWPDQGPVNWSTDWNDGHYVVLVGMDAATAYLMDPSVPNAYSTIPIPELLTRWHDMDEGHTKHGLGIVVWGTSQDVTSVPGPLQRTL